MKPLGRCKTKFEVFFLRMIDIGRKECNAFILPQDRSLKPGKICTLVSSLKEDRDGPFRVRIIGVAYKKIKKLTIREIGSLHMDDAYEILDPEGVKNHCWFNQDSIDLLPEDHPNKWLESWVSLCEDCADRVLASIHESCVKKATCSHYKENGTCNGCREADYEVGNSCCGNDSDSVGTCEFEWEENGEHKGCGNLIEYNATDECAETELAHFMEHGFDSECDFDRHSLKEIAENLQNEYSERSKEYGFVQKMLLHAIWDTHWSKTHAYKNNPMIGYHTFELV